MTPVEVEILKKNLATTSVTEETPKMASTCFSDDSTSRPPIPPPISDNIL